MTGAAGTPGHTLVVAPGVVHLWLADIRDEAFLRPGSRTDLVEAGLISRADEERAGSFVEPGAGVRLRARRVFLRKVLSRYLGCAPSEVAVVTAPGGKPVLRPGTPGESTHAFSVGHSGDLYAVAVAACASLGCDIERLRPVTRAMRIAERWFGPAEAGGLASFEGDDLDRAFMELWTGKEALAKRHGAGLRLMKGQADADAVHDELDVERERAGARLLRFDPGPGYSGAVAATTPITRVDLIRPGDARWID